MSFCIHQSFLSGAFLDNDKKFGVLASDFTMVSPVEDATENASLRCQSYRPAELGAILEVGVQLKLCTDLLQVGHLARDSSLSRAMVKLMEKTKRRKVNKVSSSVPSQWPWLISHF